jgi:hypothetical protein
LNPGFWLKRLVNAGVYFSHVSHNTHHIVIPNPVFSGEESAFSICNKTTSLAKAARDNSVTFTNANFQKAIKKRRDKSLRRFKNSIQNN